MSLDIKFWSTRGRNISKRKKNYNKWKMLRIQIYDFSQTFRWPRKVFLDLNHLSLAKLKWLKKDSNLKISQWQKRLCQSFRKIKLYEDKAQTHESNHETKKLIKLSNSCFKQSLTRLNFLIIHCLIKKQLIDLFKTKNEMMNFQK